MISLTVNGTQCELGLDPGTPLLWALRDGLGLTGTKFGCGVGRCGICVVLIDGAPNHACMVPLAKAAGRAVVTIEGLAAQGHALIAAWIAEQVPQCGYCQPGQIMAAAGLLQSVPHPTDADIDAALSGVLCRCGSYPRIRRAVRRAADDALTPAPPVDALGAAPDAGVALNAWIRVHADDTVTLQINHTEMGQGAMTALSMLVAEELEIDLAHIRTEFAPADKTYVNPMFGHQTTGGSTAVRGEWRPLRTLAAKAREQLRAAAAQRWGVPADDCHAEHGAIVHIASGRRLGYGALAEAAAAVTPPRKVALKTQDEFRLIGHRTPRLEIPAMATGRTRYGLDVQVPDQCVATLLRCPTIGGRMRSYDAADTLAVPGVQRVVATDAGVAVVADDVWSAWRGRDALRIEFEHGPHGALDNAAIYAELDAALERQGKVVRRVGNARRILAHADAVFKARYCTPYLAHATLEPMNCTARVGDDGCDIWVGTQSQGDTQAVAAQLTGRPKHQVRVHTQYCGGGFGRRLETDFVEEAVRIAQAVDRPVQLFWTRPDDFQHDLYRPAHAVELQAALDDDGRPRALFARLAGSALALESFEVAYAIPNARIERVEVDSVVPTGAWRSVGASQNAFAIECFIDELAHTAGRDPVEYRRALLGEAPRHRAVLERAAERAGWGNALPNGHGRGIAVYRCFGSWVAQVAEVSVTDQNIIKVHRVVCAIDCGIAVNPDAVSAQLEGGIALGLSATLKEELVIEQGRITANTFEDYPILTLAEMPAVEVYIMESTEAPGGVGEPGVPVVMPAVANAVFDATGRRLRRLPLRLG